MTNNTRFICSYVDQDTRIGIGDYHDSWDRAVLAAQNKCSISMGNFALAYEMLPDKDVYVRVQYFYPISKPASDPGPPR